MARIYHFIGQSFINLAYNSIQGIRIRSPDNCGIDQIPQKVPTRNSRLPFTFVIRCIAARLQIEGDLGEQGRTRKKNNIPQACEKASKAGKGDKASKTGDQKAGS
jgi:hypothetical protein